MIERMIDHQTDEEVFRDEVCDEALRLPAIAAGGLPTIMYRAYCFACPSSPLRNEITESSMA
jgi:hypothetical protein